MNVPVNLPFKIYSYATLYGNHAISSLLKLVNPAPQSTYPIQVEEETIKGEVDEYWNEHTVNALKFYTAWESNRYYDWVLMQYPYLKELMNYGENRSSQVIMDYGSGTGNCLYRLLVRNEAKKVYGVDPSYTGLKIAAKRLALHGIAPERINLVRISDKSNVIPFADNFFDHINCEGVLMHTSHPQAILKEFYRVLKPGGTADIMVYTKESIHYHLYVPYYLQILEKRFAGDNIDLAFSKSTDGEECPVARAFGAEEFMNICSSAGFNVEYKGGYFSQTELWAYRSFADAALKSEQLAPQHKEFLKQATIKNGVLHYNNKLAGLSGVYKLVKAK